MAKGDGPYLSYCNTVVEMGLECINGSFFVVFAPHIPTVGVPIVTVSAARSA